MCFIKPIKKRPKYKFSFGLQLNVKTKQKIENVDEQLNILNSEVRQSLKPPPQERDKQLLENARSVKNQQKVEKYKDSLKSDEETLNKLLLMEM